MKEYEKVTRNVSARLGASTLMALALLAVAVLPVAAHASIPDGTAVPAGGSAVIHVRLPHGCDGAPITAVKVQLPDGVVGAKPELIAGWTATTEMVPAKYTLFGTDYTERVGTITWQGGPLPDGQFLDFGINATFQLEPGEYGLPVIQECGSTSVAWIEEPAAGQTHDDLEHPAPEFVVVEAAAEGHDHAGTESPAPSDAHMGDTGSDTAAMAAELAAVKTQVSALEAANAATTTSGTDTTPTLALTLVALAAGLGGLALGVVAVRRRS